MVTDRSAPARGYAFGFGVDITLSLIPGRRSLFLSKSGAAV